MSEYRKSSKKNDPEAVNILKLVLEACHLRPTMEDITPSRDDKLAISMPEMYCILIMKSS